MRIVLVILLLAAFVGGMTGLMIFLVKKLDPMKDDKSEEAKLDIAQDFLPFEDIRDDMILLPDYCYRAVIECSSINYDLKTDDERTQIELSFQQFINSLSSPISIFLQTKEIDNSKRMESLQADTKAAIQAFPGLETYANYYLKEMKTLNSKIGNSQQKKRYIVVSYDDAGQLEQLSAGEKATYAMKELQNRCNAIMNGLDAVGVHSHKLSTAELVLLLYSCYNRKNQSFAEAISSNDAFALFVDGTEDKFKDLPRVGMLDLILGESINRIRMNSIDNDAAGKAVLEQLEQLRQKYAGYFIEEA